MSEEGLLQCYNRGCGKKYCPNENTDESCRHHPGQPVFHDAYKGWSCCNKKCTDFTEFLNIPGCTLSKHSNEKPPEPEKPPQPDIPDMEVIEVKPIVPSSLKRPPFNTPMVTLTPELAPSLKQQLNTAKPAETKPEENKIKSSQVDVGTTCKNGGCNVIYQGPHTSSTICIYHPGVPIFHEGLKFWSCCQKRTSDFQSFLNQVGCERGSHVWIKEDTNKQVQCRWDYHQTGSLVVVSIYAKNYCPKTSIVQLNPIRLYVNLVFPHESKRNFMLDFELKGIVNVDESNVTMFGTKVEIKLKKAEPGAWAKLEVPRKESENECKNKEAEGKEAVDSLTPQVDAVDLSDL